MKECERPDVAACLAPGIADALATPAEGGTSPALFAAIDLLPIGVLLVSGASLETATIVHANPAITAMVGCSIAPGMLVTDLPLVPYQPDRAAPMAVSERPSARMLVSGETVRDAEVHIRLADGSFRVGDLTVSPVRSARGCIAGALVVVQDITERKQAEEALRRSEERLARSQQIAHLGSWELDLEQDVLTWSDEVSRIFGLQPQEFGATYEAFLDHVHPDDRAAVDDAYSGSVRDGRDAYQIEHRVVRQATGEVRWVQEKCQHVRDGTGRIIRSLGMVHDITENRATEDALRESEERFRVMADSSPVVIWVTDSEGGLWFANRRYCDFFGVTFEQVKGCDWQPLVHPDDVPAYTEAFIHARGARTAFKAEARVKRADGEWRWIASQAEPRFTASGEFLGYIGISPDITARKQAEDALQQRNAELDAERARWRVTVESMSYPVAVCDVQGHVVYMNAACSRLVGRAIGEGVPLAEHARDCELHRPDGTAFPPEEMPLQRAALRGEEVRDLEVIQRAAGGGEIRVVWNAAPLRVNGEIVGAVAVGQDITVEWQMQEALRESEARERARAAELRAILDAVPAGVWITHTRDSRRMEGNRVAHALLNLPPGANLSKSAPPDEMPTTYRVVKAGVEIPPAELPVQVAAARGADVRDCEFDVEYPDGVRRTLFGNATPLRDPEGHPRGAVGAFVDITERKHAEDALRQANEALREADRRKDEFLAMLGHELRNPLAAIANAVHLMGTPGLGEPILDRARQAAARQAEHMGRLLDDLLDVSRVTQGKIALRDDEVDLAPVVESALEAARPLIESRAQTFSLDLAGGPLKVKGDAVRLAQVISNLLNNAARYTPVGGNIWLSVGRQAGEAQIRVRDDGNGIAPDLLPRIFDLFVQGERSLGRIEGGLGIGLTMVKRLVEMHDGRVDALSDGPGRGSEFVVSLPLVEGFRVQGSGRAGRNPEPRTMNPHRRILVVDDNADTAELLAMILEAEGHEVVVAHDGPAALEVAGGHRPDLVLLDLGLPGMDGYEVAERLRQMPCLGETPLVAFTGYGQDEDRERTARAGFAYHLVKPVDADALRRVLEGVPARPEG